jgi:hypothetical protein
VLDRDPSADGGVTHDGRMNTRMHIPLGERTNV